jgi:hypothetical protein
VRLAARGARETAGGGTAAIEDQDELRQLRRQAARVYRESAAIAVLVTGVAMLARGLLGT